MAIETLVERDLKAVWHPCAQMKDYETFKPLIVKAAKGSYIELNNGHKLIDAISNWWCKSLGHGHPRLKQALIDQANQFEHVLLANTTNPTIVELSERLTGLMPELNKVMFASDGSCAIEMALKMSLHARQLLGQSEKKQFLTLANSYHGETLATLNVSDVGLYCAPYQLAGFQAKVLAPLPYVTGPTDPLWHDCSDAWQAILPQLEATADTTTAVIVEPIVQGSGGMKIYSQDFLRRLRAWTRAHDIYLIADEIMTGIGRTGKMLACQYADIKPDFLCLSKGLTAGWLPLSCVLTKNDIYDLFYDDYATGKAFLHSHTHSGNALAASVALETLKIFEEEAICARVNHELAPLMLQAMHDVAQNTGMLHNIRGIGAVVAADIVGADPKQRLGYQVYQKAVELGALLRPLGNTIYWLPPLNISIATLEELKNITQEALLTTLSQF